jgi:hypothetical protein
MVVTGLAAAKRSVWRQNGTADGWMMLPAVVVPIAVLIMASSSIGFTCICDPATSILQLLEALLPASLRRVPTASWTPLGLLLDLQQSRVLTTDGAALLVAMLLQGVACAAAFGCIALRSTAFMGLLAALVLACNPAWLRLLAQAPGTATGLVAIVLGLAVMAAISRIHARFLIIAAAIGVGLFVAVTGWTSLGAAIAPAPPLLVGAAFGPFLGILVLALRPGQPDTVKASAIGVLVLGLIASMLLGVGGAGSSSRRQIEEEQAKLAAQRAFQDLLRPFIRSAGHVVLWDQTARTPEFGPVTSLPRRFDISPYELSYALRSMNSPVVVMIACAQRSDCSAAHGALDAIDVATQILLDGGRLSVGCKDLHYMVVRLLLVKPQ